MKAVRRFDPERGVRLVSFALHWIRAEMHEYILRNWRLVKVATTKAQRKLFFNLRSMKASSAALSRRRSRRRSRRTSASSPRRSSRWRRASGGHDLALDPTPGDEENFVSPIAYLTDSEDEPAQILEREETAQNRTKGLQTRAREARRPQPPDHRSALAARGRLVRDAAGPRQRVRRVRRADPPDREQGDEDDAQRRWPRSSLSVAARLRDAARRRRPRAGVLALSRRRNRPLAQAGEGPDAFTARPACPSSTTRLVGIWKNSDAFTAFFDIDTNSRSRHSAMPGATVGISVSRETKNDVSIMSNAKPRRPRLLEELRHVGVLLESVVREDLVEVAAERLDLDAVVVGARTECRAMTTVRNTTRSCSTLLCFRLCSSACGTRSGVDGHEHRGARRRASAATTSMLWMKTSSGSASSDSLSISSARPRFHVVSSVNTTAPISEREPAAVGDLERVRREEREVDQRAAARRSRRRATAASSTAAASRRRSGSSRSASRASPRCRRRRPGCRTCGSRRTSSDDRDEQRPVDERHVDLADLALGRVLDRAGAGSSPSGSPRASARTRPRSPPATR